jgi:hypothetical protein
MRDDLIGDFQLLTSAIDGSILRGRGFISVLRDITQAATIFFEDPRFRTALEGIAAGFAISGKAGESYLNILRELAKETGQISISDSLLKEIVPDEKAFEFVKKAIKEVNDANLELIRTTESRNKFFAQSLINEYGGISEAITGLRQIIKDSEDPVYQLSHAFDEGSLHALALANSTEVLAILQKRQKDATLEQIKSVANLPNNLQTLEDKIKILNEEYKKIDVTKINELARNRELVDSYQQQIEKLEFLIQFQGKQFKFTQGPISTVSTSELDLGLQPKPYEMQFNMDEAVAGIQRYAESLAKADAEQQKLNRSTNEFNLNISQLATGALSDVADAFGRAAVSGGNFGTTILKAVGGFMKQFGEQLIALGVAKLGLDTLFVTGYGAAFAIAAGVALVAAAGAVSQSAASSLSSISSGGQGSSGGTYGTYRYAGRYSAGDASNNWKVEFKIRGADLVGVLATAQNNNKFTRGS